MSKPVLAPGLRVLRRSRTVLQVGLGAGRRVLLPDSEPARRTLEHLARGEVLPEDPATREVLDLLSPVLVDAGRLVVPGVGEGDVAALALLDPTGYPDRLRSRRAARVQVTGAVGAVDPRPLLEAAGLQVQNPAASTRPTVALCLRVGEIDREQVDPWVRRGVPHLFVRLVEGTAVIGPFVEPGRTACLRCLDAHHAERDPQTAVLTTAHARAAGRRRDGVAEPIDTALATLAVSWAVRDVVTHVEGDRPSTWSTTVELSATLSTVTHAEWLRHPACGCSWLPDEQLSRTMGA